MRSRQRSERSSSATHDELVTDLGRAPRERRRAGSQQSSSPSPRRRRAGSSRRSPGSAARTSLPKRWFPRPRWPRHASTRWCERRVAGEPLQYVLGAWSFRGIDLFVDPRVLVPRPETETTAEVAIGELHGPWRAPRCAIGVDRHDYDVHGRRPGDGKWRAGARAGHRAPGCRGVGHRPEPRRARSGPGQSRRCRERGDTNTPRGG